MTPQNQTTAPANAIAGLWETAKTITLAAVLAVSIHTFLFQPFYIPSGSMVPTLEIRDYLFVNKFIYGYSRYSFPFNIDLFPGRFPARAPERGDIVVIAPTPTAGTADLIKRVIGLPGDTIQLINGVLYVNNTSVGMRDEGLVTDDSDGFPVPLEKFTETLPNGHQHPILKLTSDGSMNNTPIYNVPPGHIFLMGDNRDNSLDSRFLDDLGYVPIQNVVGKAEVIFFSIDLTHPWLEFWYWPTEIRWSRLLHPVT